MNRIKHFFILSFYFLLSVSEAILCAAGCTNKGTTKWGEDEFYYSSGRTWQDELKCADEGSVEAMINVAFFYQYGPFSIRDYDKAIEYYSKIIKNDQEVGRIKECALYELGNIYLNNPYDESLAEKYLTEAAKRNYIPAIKALAHFYYDIGREVEAIDLFNRVLIIGGGDHTFLEEYVGSIIELYNINMQKPKPDIVESERLLDLINKNSDVLSYTNAGAIYKYRHADLHKLTPEEDNQVKYVLTNTREGFSVLVDRFPPNHIDAAVMFVKREVENRKEQGWYCSTDISLREVASDIGKYLVEERAFDSAYMLLDWAAENGSVDAAVHLAYFVYGEPSGEFGDGESPWPKSYRNPEKAQKYKDIVDKFGYKGPSGY